MFLSPINNRCNKIIIVQFYYNYFYHYTVRIIVLVNPYHSNEIIMVFFYYLFQFIEKLIGNFIIVIKL
jgi:hypothetical protein